MLSNKIIKNKNIIINNNEIKNYIINKYFTTINNSNNNNNNSGNNKKIKTGILMLNLGGPSNLNEVEPFLTRLFTDKEIFKLPFQQYTGTLIAKRRAPTVKKLYAAIGGGSPIKKWTDLQGEKLTQLLDQLSPETAPHKHYIGFRYSDPLISDTIEEMKNDQVERVVAFSQYPQFSCTTTGSSLNNLWKTLEEKNMKNHFKWSVIDRWENHEGFINATKSKIEKAISQYYTKLNQQQQEGNNSNSNNKPVLVFSAHSLPMSTVEKGDPYPHEVSETVCKVMDSLNKDKSDSFEYILAWQSKVGPLPWLSPKTSFVIDQLAKNNRNAIVIPIAFTSDHIETLSEIDIELQELSKKSGMKLLVRSESLNDDPLIISAMADLVKSHLHSNNPIYSNQYSLKCPGCKDTINCRQILNPINDNNSNSNSSNNNNNNSNNKHL